MYFRVKRTGLYPYLQVVQSYREGGQVRQRVMATFGRLDVLQATGQMDALMRSGLRFCEKLAVIDPHAAGGDGGGGRAAHRRIQRGPCPPRPSSGHSG